MIEIVVKSAPISTDVDELFFHVLMRWKTLLKLVVMEDWAFADFWAILTAEFSLLTNCENWKILNINRTHIKTVRAVLSETCTCADFRIGKKWEIKNERIENNKKLSEFKKVAIDHGKNDHLPTDLIIVFGCSSSLYCAAVVLFLSVCPITILNV